MDVPVVVAPVGADYRARCRHPVAAEATGATRYEALHALEAALVGRVPGPLTLLPLEATPDKPRVAAAGWLPDDDLTRQYLDLPVVPADGAADARVRVLVSGPDGRFLRRGEFRTDVGHIRFGTRGYVRGGREQGPTTSDGEAQP